MTDQWGREREGLECIGRPPSGPRAPCLSRHGPSLSHCKTQAAKVLGTQDLKLLRITGPFKDLMKTMGHLWRKRQTSRKYLEETYTNLPENARFSRRGHTAGRQALAKRRLPLCVDDTMSPE